VLIFARSPLAGAFSGRFEFLKSLKTMILSKVSASLTDKRVAVRLYPLIKIR
jgi:hypothetical protein